MRSAQLRLFGQGLALALAASVLSTAAPAQPATAAAGQFEARAGAGPVERPLPAGAGARRRPDAGRVPAVPPSARAGGPVRRLTPTEREARRRAAGPQVLAAPTGVVLRPGFLLGDVSLVAYFEADVDENDPASWNEWWATVTDVESGDEQRSAVLGRADLARCGVPREYCRSFGTADGWALSEGREYVATVTVRRPDGTEETSTGSAPARARRTSSPPGMPPGQASGCACPNVLGPTVTAQELRGALVNTATGAFVRSERDLGMPSFGIPFEAIRFYSSANPSVGMFGPGWTWTYDARVVAADDGAVRVRAEDGAEAVFRRQEDGSYRRPPGVRARLSRVPGGWRLVPPDQRTLTFDAEGRLTAITDARGHGVTLAYDTAGRLVGVTDAAGRVVTIASNAEGRIEAISLPDGRSVRFTYADGRLAEAIDARGFAWRYAYDGAGRLTTVTDPRGALDVANTYGPDGRVTEQRDGTGARTRFEWDAREQEARTTDADGVVTFDGYRDNVLVHTQNGNGDTINHRYDEQLRRQLVVDAKGNQQETTHDADGNPIERTAPEPFAFTERNEFDGRNNLIRHTDGRANTWTSAYNDRNEMTGQSDPEQGEGGYRYERDERGLLRRRTDARGKVTTFEHDRFGNRAAEISPTGRRTEFDHDLTGRMTCIIDPRGTVPGGGAHQHDAFHTRLRYDAQDRLVERRDAGKQGAQRSTFDEVGNLVAETDPLGNISRFRYDEANRLVEHTDPLDNVTRYTYTPAGRRALETDAEGNTTTWTYDGQGRARTQTSPRGNAEGGARRADFTTTYDYDFNGNIVRASRPFPGGGTVQVDTEYDELNRPVRQTDELGNTTRVAYDEAHNPVSLTDEQGRKVDLSYDRAGRRTGGRDAEGRNGTGTTYDAAGNPIRQTSPTGGVTTYHYDDDGRVAAVTDPRSFTTTFTYDLAGNPETVTDPLGRVTRTRYDQSNRLVARTDANGHTTSIRYDDADRVVAVVGPDAHAAAGDAGPAATYDYDANGRVVRRTDPQGHATTVDYDRADRAVASTDPLGRTRRYRYDPDGNVTELVTASDPAGDPAARTVFSTYDNLDRLTEKRLGTGGPRYTFGYDAKSRLVSLGDPTGVQTYDYDTNDRLTAASRGDERFTYTYDTNDNITGRTYPDGTRVTADFDAGDRVTSMTATGPGAGDAGGGGSTRFEFAYDAADNLTRTTYPAATGIVEDRSYDPTGRLIGITSARGPGGTPLARYDLERDPVGNPTRVTTTRGGPGQPAVTEAVGYRYDAADRLTSACYGVPSCEGPVAERLDYTYDLVGNRTSELRRDAGGDTRTTYEYDAADQLVREITGGGLSGGTTTERTFAYDGEGNQVRAGDDTYAYRLDHTLASARVAGSETTYEHDAAGNLISSRTGSGRDATERRWAWDVNSGLPLLANETVTAGGARDRRGFLYGGTAQPLALLAPAGAGHRSHAYLHDWLDGVGGVVSPDGVPEWAYDYEPFGASRGAELDQGGHRLTPEAPENPLRFTGAYADGTQGERYHLRARNYDPGTGRFDVTDAMPESPTTPAVSSYAYAGNRPTVSTDHSGMAPMLDGSGGASSARGTSRGDQRAGDADDDSDFDPYEEQRESARKRVDEAEGAINQAGDEIIGLLLDLVGYNDAKACVTDGDVIACIMMVLGAVPWTKAFKAAKALIKAVGVGKRLIEAYSDLRSARKALDSIPDPPKRVSDGGAKAANKASDAARRNSSTPRGPTNRARQATRRVTNKARRDTDCNSFVPGTRVVMADGSTKPIERVAPGDAVRASDPATGATEPAPVTAVIKGPGTETRQLVDLSLVGAGAGGGGPPPPAGAPDRITATTGHPFWTDRGWVPAGELRPGDRLRGQGGETVTVASVVSRTARTAVHDLTVTGHHTFFVQASDGTSALTHNRTCGTGGSGGAGRGGGRGSSSGSSATRSSGPGGVASTNPTNRELIQAIATRAERRIGGTGRAAGSRKHAYADRLLRRYQDLYGYRGLDAEVSYLNKTRVPYGTKGSVRLDVEDVWNNVVYDYKFTTKAPDLKRRQVDRIVNERPLVPWVIEINP